MHNLRQVDAKESRLPVQATSSSPNTNRINALLHNERDDHAAVTDELQDAEAGLNKAKEEYRRLQQEVLNLRTRATIAQLICSISCSWQHLRKR